MINAAADTRPALLILTTTGSVERGIPAGVEMEVFENSTGVVEGYGYVVNGWAHGLEHFDKPSDGDTVVACDADHPAALPVADAYWQLQRAYDEELVDMIQMELDDDWTSMDDVERTYAHRPNVLEMLTARLEGRLDKDIAGSNLLGDEAPLTQNPFASTAKGF